MLHQNWFYKKSMDMFYDHGDLQKFYDRENGMIYVVEECHEGTRITEYEYQNSIGYLMLKEEYDLYLEECANEKN